MLLKPGRDEVHALFGKRKNSMLLRNVFGSLFDKEQSLNWKRMEPERVFTKQRPRGLSWSTMSR
jgi:hypothetical protein